MYENIFIYSRFNLLFVILAPYTSNRREFDFEFFINMLRNVNGFTVDL